MREAGTLRPAAAMMPAPSLCGTTFAPPSGRPARLFTSEGLTPETLSLTRTSPGPGSGVGRSPTIKTSRAAPLRSYHAAFMVMGCKAFAGHIHADVFQPDLEETRAEKKSPSHDRLGFGAFRCGI